MKLVLILLTTLWPLSIFGQALDSLGASNSKFLNKEEADFLNQDLINYRDDFDFTNKKIAFVSGHTGNSLWTKKEYFEKNVKPRLGTKKKLNSALIILTLEEKVNSGGYDALVITPDKPFSDKHKQRVLGKLEKQ